MDIRPRNDPVEQLFRAAKSAGEDLTKRSEISYANDLGAASAKALLLAAASSFERRISVAIGALASRASNDNEQLCALVATKAVNRQYHTYFDWKGQSVNPFFANFGSSFKWVQIGPCHAAWASWGSG
jgi:hypothetical protein